MKPTEEDMARDAAKDMKVCDGTAPLPWVVEKAEKWGDDERVVAPCPCCGLIATCAAFGGETHAGFIVLAREALPSWIRRAAHAEAEAKTLREAITAHHGQKADDRCTLDDDRLYAAAGLPPCDRRVGDKAAMLRNCERFIDRRCEGGHWPSYVDLEAEVAEWRRKAADDLRRQLEEDGDAVRAWKEEREWRERLQKELAELRGGG